MHQPDQKTILHLLVKAHNNALMDFYYFPEVVFAGKQRIDKDDFEYLLAAGYLAKYKHDVFGRYYHLSAKGQSYLYEHLVLQRPKKKRMTTFANQSQLHF